MAQKRQHNHESRVKQAELVRSLVRENYEPGRQDRCKSWVYRNIVKPRIGISEKTFWRYLGVKIIKPIEDKNQLKLFDD